MNGASRVVVLFGGGGAKAACHAGAWRALVEEWLTPAQIYGTSMGAVVGAALACGLSPEEVQARMSAIRRADVARPRLLALVAGFYADSILKPGPLRHTIERFVPARSFSELRIPLTVTAVDADSGALVTFGIGGDESVPLIDALCASCALPLYYPAVAINSRRYIDGGHRGVTPFEAAAGERADLVVAVDPGPGFDEPDTPPPPAPAMIRAHDDATGILMAALSWAQLAAWRADPSRPPLVYVRPRVSRNATFDVASVAAYAAEGYRATREALVSRGHH